MSQSGRVGSQKMGGPWVGPFLIRTKKFGFERFKMCWFGLCLQILARLVGRKELQQYNSCAYVVSQLTCLNVQKKLTMLNCYQWGRISVARPWVVVHRMQVTTTIGPAPTCPSYHSWVVLIFYEKPVQTKESRQTWTTLQHLGIFLNVRFIYKSL